MSGSEWWFNRRRGQGIWCSFAHENPEPKPKCTCCPCGEHAFCDCAAAEWSPVIECLRPVTVRVILTDGRWMDACDARAHGHPVAWWSELVQAFWESDFDRIAKYHYRMEDIETMAMKPHPFFDLVKARDPGEPLHKVTYDGKPPR